MANRYPDIAAFAARLYAADPASLRLQVVPFRGGLESVQVAGVRCEYRDRRGRRRLARFVSKRVPQQGAREVAVYRDLLREEGACFAPRLLGTERAVGGVRLYLEWIRPWRAWPWADREVIARAMERLAAAHTSLSASSFRASDELAAWDYERELAASAAATVEAFESVSGREEARPFRRAMPGMRRLAANLAALRRQMRECDPGPVVLHGDVHTGNVLVRVRGGAAEPVLLDWARTRVGSPLEDVSSWLQSLGYWEPEAKRLHDTLLRRYLTARGLSTGLSRARRAAYWIAAASNGLAGAVRYHLLTLLDERRPVKDRVSAHAALRDWLRVLRRADAASRA